MEELPKPEELPKLEELPKVDPFPVPNVDWFWPKVDWFWPKVPPLLLFPEPPLGVPIVAARPADAPWV